jgi:membrane fusion protein (multidrug efflux system)
MEEVIKKKSFFKTTLGIFLIIIVLLVLIVGGFLLYRYLRTHVSTNDAIIDGYAAQISPDITARIIKLYVDEGDVVEAGELLVQLDESIFLSQRAAAEARVQSAIVNVKLKEIHNARVKDDYERAKKAFHDKILSVQDMDHAQKDHEYSWTQVEMARADLELAQKDLGEILELLRHTKVYAPRQGAIAKRWVLAGDVMVPGQSMFSMYDLEHVWVTALLEETKVADVRLGGHVDISVDAYPGVKFTGKVFAIRGAAASQFSLIPPDNATGNYTKVAQRVPLKISIEPPHNKEGKTLYLFPGMSAEIIIHVK